MPPGVPAMTLPATAPMYRHYGLFRLYYAIGSQAPRSFRYSRVDFAAIRAADASFIAFRPMPALRRRLQARR